MPTVILKDDDKNPVTDPLTGRKVEEIVSEDVAAFLAENDSYMKKLENIDDRHFGLLHFEDQAWSNLQDLSTGFSTEDQCLGALREAAAVERAHYIIRLDSCRRAYRLLFEACTATQWRLLILHQFYGLTYRKIAQREGVNDKSVVESVQAAKKKSKIIFAKLT